MAVAFERPQSQNIPIVDCGMQQRPASMLTRGVQITELCDGSCMNPDPIKLQESPILRDQCLSPTKLQLLTGSERLESVSSVELKVDTCTTSLHNFGLLLPNLTVLKLSGSVVPKIRDLGTSLQSVEVLWMRGCWVQELEGVCSMGQLRELYLAYNDVTDLAPLALLDLLTTLDLEGNNVDDIGQLDYLALCSKLQHVTLEGNPICVAPHPDCVEDNYDYRQAVKMTLTTLTTLDDKPLTSADSGSSSPQNVFDADWAFLEELQGDALLIESLEKESETVSTAGRPTTAALLPATAYRPGSALKPASGMRPLTSALHRPASISGGRPSTAWTDSSKPRPASSDGVEGVDVASDLTCGVVVCGNPSKALRAHRHREASQGEVPPAFSFHCCGQSLTQAQEPKPQRSSQLDLRPVPATKINEEEEEEKGRSRKGGRGNEEEEEEEEREEEGPIEDKDLSHLLQELKSWKKEHEKRLEKIRESKAPQVLRIDDDAEEDSGSNLSPTGDMDSTADTDTQQSHPQITRPSSRHHPAASHISSFSCDGDEPGHYPSLSAHGHTEKLVATHRKSSSSSLRDSEKCLDEDREKRVTHRKSSASTLRDSEKCLGKDREKQITRRKSSSSSLRDLEKCLDDDSSVLLKEYGRLTVLDKHAERALEHTASGDHSGGLRELRVAHRPPGHRRIVVPKSPSSSSPRVTESLLSPGRESSPPKDRPRKVRIGPTGLPSSSPSSHSKQAAHVVGDLLSSAADHRPGMGGVPTHPSISHHPPVPPTTAGQHRVRRSLPEVTPLPSRPTPPLFRS